MVEQTEFQESKDTASDHPAVWAWSRLNTGAVDPGRIWVLKKRFKSTIYRIDNLGPGPSSIVAKYCRREVAEHERVIYEDILPKLAVSSPCYYGFVKGEGDYDWLFLECVEGERFCRERQDHCALAGTWLGHLHTLGENAAVAGTRLPDRGIGHYHGQLRTARARFETNLKYLKLLEEESAVVQSVISQCNFLESHWKQIERWCAQMPRTLVHGDFKPRNVVIRTTPQGPSLLTFDWETSGWGVPAEDLAYIDLGAYHAIAKRCWPKVTMQALQCMKIVGRIFRGLSEFCWESVKFEPHWEVSTVKLRVYQMRMAEGIEMAEWRE